MDSNHRGLSKTFFRLAWIAIAATASASAAAGTANWSAGNPALVTAPSSISQTVDGVVVTARGYVAEFNATTSTIIGPFPTLFHGSRQVFGPSTTAGSSGLGLYVVDVPGLSPTGFDYGGSTVLPGFDSGICVVHPCSYLSDNPDIPGPPRPKMDFAIFTFSAPVSIVSFDTDEANTWWAAGWSSAVDLGAGIEGALATAQVVQSKGSDIDPFLHRLDGFDSITTLAIGYQPPVSGFGLPELNRAGGFFINDITMAAVPEPSAPMLLLGGIGMLALLRRRRPPNAR
jgi:hypothetical protein